MPVQRRPVPQRPRSQVLITIRTAVGVATPEYQGDEPPRMIVKSTGIIRGQPVMDSQRADSRDLDSPSDDVRALGQAEPFMPPELVPGDGLRPTDLRLIWTMLLTH